MIFRLAIISNVSNKYLLESLFYSLKCFSPAHSFQVPSTLRKLIPTTNIHPLLRPVKATGIQWTLVHCALSLSGFLQFILDTATLPFDRVLLLPRPVPSFRSLHSPAAVGTCPKLLRSLQYCTMRCNDWKGHWENFPGLGKGEENSLRFLHLSNLYLLFIM